MTLVVNQETKKWTKAEFHRLLESDIIPPDHWVELIEGEIVEMPDKKTRIHKWGIVSTNELFVKAFTPEFRVGCQVPMDCGEYSEPLPDFQVWRRGHNEEGDTPESSLLLEVSNTSLRYDRTEKASLYARQGIPEYWVLDLVHRTLLVQRNPGPDPEATFGHAYREVETLQEDGVVTPVCKPDVSLRVAQLLEQD
jgi:Uma2 family endonuclease